MGSSESTRNVTLEKETEEDSAGIVRVSERVVRRLRGIQDLPLNANDDLTPEELNKLWRELHHEKAHVESQRNKLQGLLQKAFEEGRGSTLSSDHGQGIDATELEGLKDDMKMRESDLLREIESLRQKNSNIDVLTEDHFNAAVEEVKEKFRPVQRPAVCQSLQQQVIDCYQEHPNQTLHCSQHVKDFQNCVQMSRAGTLQDSKS